MHIEDKEKSHESAIFLVYMKKMSYLCEKFRRVMAQEEAIKLFGEKNIRVVWDDVEEKYYFSVTDIVQVLTEQSTARGASTYWAVLKKRLLEEGANELLTNCKQLKLTARDGKQRLTDVADTEQVLRIIQSIPSKKAEPFKQWREIT